MKLLKKFVFTFAIIFSILSLPIFSQNLEKTVKIGCPLETGFYKNNKKDENNGIGFYYEKLISHYANWKIEYECDSWANLLEKLELGKIDVLGFVVKTPEREKKINFTESPFGVSESYLICNSNVKKYYFNDFKAFNGMTVGFQKSNANAKLLEEWARNHGFSVVLKEYPSLQDVYDALDLGEIDTALVTNSNILVGYDLVAKMISQTVYYAVNNKRIDLLNDLNSAINNINIFYPNLFQDLFTDFSKKLNVYSLAFTREESEYLASKPIVKVFNDSKVPPFYFYDKKEKVFKGIIPNVLNQISQNTGIIFEYVDFNHSFETENNSSEKSNSLIIFTNNFDWSTEKNLFLTQPFIKSDVSIVSINAKVPIKTVSVVKKKYISYEINRLYPDYICLEYDSAEECLDAVVTRKADAAFLNSIEADFYFTIPKYARLHEEICKDFDQSICFALSKNSNRILCEVLSKAILKISYEDYLTFTKNIINYNRRMNIFDLAYSNPHQMIVLSCVSFFLIFILFVLVVKVRRAYIVIRDMSLHDVVTGLYNRIGLEHFFNDRSSSGISKTKLKQVSCIYMDANGLHELNNSLGHEQGDAYLRKAAEIMQCVFSNKNVFRIGGDEFIVIEKNKTAEYISSQIEKMMILFKKSGISISVGVAYSDFIENKREMDSLISKADGQMLIEKHNFYFQKGRSIR